MPVTPAGESAGAGPATPGRERIATAAGEVAASGRGPIATGGQNLSHQGRTSTSSVQAERSWQWSA